VKRRGGEVRDGEGKEGEGGKRREMEGEAGREEL